MFIVKISPEGSADYRFYPKVLELALSQSHLSRENATQFSRAVVIHTLLIFVPPGTHYWRVDRGGMDSKFAQGFLHMIGPAEVEPQTPRS